MARATIAREKPQAPGSSPPERRPRVGAIRLGLVALAAVFLWLATIAEERFTEVALSDFRFDLRLWSATITPFVLAGVAFAMAVRYPWGPGRYGWRRLALAALAIGPAVHLGLLRWTPQLGWTEPAWLLHYRWFDEGAVPAAGAVLCGVAIASGVAVRTAARHGDAGPRG